MFWLMDDFNVFCNNCCSSNKKHAPTQTDTNRQTKCEQTKNNEITVKF